MEDTRNVRECPVIEDWNVYREKVLSALDKVEKTYTATTQLVEHTKHLEKLECLVDIRDKLVDSATGRKQLDIETARVIFKYFGSIILVLIVAIFFLLTGHQFKILELFNR